MKNIGDIIIADDREYRILNITGRGASCIAYLAERSEKDLVTKCILKEFDPQNTEDYERGKKRFIDSGKRQNQIRQYSCLNNQTPPGADGLSASLDIGNSETKDEVTMVQEEEQKPLEIIDYGWCGTPNEYSDSVYIDYCAKVHNPNTGFAALFPEVLVTVRNAEGHILATDSHMGGKIMPEDSVILASTFSILKEDITDDAQIYFDVQWREMTSSDMDKYSKTSDFEIINVSERAAKHDSRVTGEIVNNFGCDVDMVKLTLLFKKDGKIVGIENTFLDNLKSGKATPFEFSFWSEIPEHDDMEISAQDW